MDLIEVFKIVEKNLGNINNELGFSVKEKADESITFSGSKGAYRIVYDQNSETFAFECSYDTESESPEFNTISKSLFELDSYNDRDAKSLANEISDELSSLFNARKKTNLDKVKMPKAVSRTKAKNGIISYDVDSLANRFGTLYPEFKENIRKNISQYGEFFPETFFIEIGTPKVMDVIANGSEAEQKKLFKMLNEVYEDGTNEVQDIIGVTILGEMRNDKKLMETAEKYMSEYMSGPVHEINKITGKKSGSGLAKKLANPPAYKPKKKKSNLMSSVLSQQNNQ